MEAIQEMDSETISCRVSSADIRRHYSDEKSRLDLTSHLWIYLVLRPISFRLAPLFINWGFTANVMTALGVLPLAAGLIFLLLGAVSRWNFIMGAVLINIWVLFDCMDGDIARFRGESSRFGALLDFLVGLIYHTLLPVCLGVGLYLSSPGALMLTLELELPIWLWLVAGVVESSAGLFRKVASLQSRSIIRGQDRERRDSRITIWTVLPRAFLSFKAPLLLIASLVGALGFFLFGYAAYNLVSLLAMIVLSLRKTLLVDRQQLDEKGDL